MHRIGSRLSITGCPLASLLAALLASLLGSGAAHATQLIAGAPEPEKKSERRNEVNVGLLVGGSDIGETRRQTVGLQLDIGRRFGDLVILGEYNYLDIGKPESMSQGNLSRFGLVARYSLLRTRNDQDDPYKRSPVSGDYWFELGAGMQRLVWDAGGTLTRPDLVFGIGWQLNVVLDRRSPKPRYYGPYVAFRANLSRAPESSLDVPPTCGGPCDTPTRPSPNDIGMFFHVGVNWGR